MDKLKPHGRQTPVQQAHTFPAGRHLFLLVICCLCSIALFSQPKAFASLKPERVETGDTFQLFVIVSGSKSSPKSVDFVSWTDVFLISNILKRSEWRKSGTQWLQQFTLIAFDSAKLELPPLTVLQNVGDPLTTNALSLSVMPTRGSELSEMEPIRDIYREPVLWTDYWPLAAAALVVVLLVYWMIRKRARKPIPVAAPVAIQPPPVSATEIALKKLSELQSQQLWKNGQVKEHHAQLSLIVREYLEKHFGIAALESTTSEILNMLSSTGLPANRTPILKDILNNTDLVKYAQSLPPESMHDAILEKARELIAPDQVIAPPQKSAQAEKKSTPRPNSGKYEPL